MQDINEDNESIRGTHNICYLQRIETVSNERFCCYFHINHVIADIIEFCKSSNPTCKNVIFKIQTNKVKCKKRYE